MSRYDDPAETGDYSAPRRQRRGTRSRRRSGDDTGSWTSGKFGRTGPDLDLIDGRRGGGRTIFSRHPVVSVLAIALTVAVTGGSLYAYAQVRNVYDRIDIQTIGSGQLEQNRPPELVPGALNILLIGSDSRKGTHGKYGSASGPNGIQGSRSDTSMVLHISPDHRHAVVVSFPRDAMVPIYACKPDGRGHMGQQAGAPGALEPTNWTFSFGGVPCLWKTLESTTRIHFDAFAEVNFSGFKSIVNDVGGVEVCLPMAINDPASGLHLSAGRHLVKGAQALAFVRERHIGEGSDLQRITRQQYFLAAAIQKVEHTSLLSQPSRIYNVVKDVAGSLTTSMSLKEMFALANSLKGLNPSAVQFISVPVAPYPPNPANQVEWLNPDAEQLFNSIRHDTKIPKSVSRAAKAKPSPLPTVSPGKVRVKVLNGTSTTGLAGQTGTDLAGRGFTVTGSGDAPSSNFTKTYIEYGSPSQVVAADTLLKEIPNATLQLKSGISRTKLTLILGSSFTGLKSHKKSKPKVTNLVQNYGGISANTNICKDSGAFTGGDTPSMFGP